MFLLRYELKYSNLVLEVGTTGSTSYTILLLS